MMPFRKAAIVFSFKPPMGRTRPRRVTSPVMAMPRRTGQPVRADTMAVVMAMPGRGPVLGDGSLREVDVDILLLIKIGGDPQPV